MKITIVLLVCASILTGCATATPHETTTPDEELQKLRDENAKLKQAIADDYQPPGPGGLPSESPVPPDVSGQIAINGGGTYGQNGMYGGATVSEPLRGATQGYICATGSEPRQVLKEKMLKIVNNYCDGRRDGGLNCHDNDSALSIMIEGKPVMIDVGVLSKRNNTCFVSVDRARRVRVEFYRHPNVGTALVPKYDFSVVDGYYAETIEVDTNVQLVDITEDKSWSDI